MDQVYNSSLSQKQNEVNTPKAPLPNLWNSARNTSVHKNDYKIMNGNISEKIDFNRIKD
jgi:hypothetical protein